jgi:hypothetical protein
MTGKKGRSGKCHTPQERQAKRTAGRMAGNAKAGRSRPRPEGSVDHSPALLAAFPELAGYPFPVADSLGLKDALEAALKSAKAHQAEVELDEARAKRDLARGKSLTKDEHTARCVALAELFVSRLSIITSAAVDLLPPEQQPAARHAIDQAVAEYRRQVAAATKDHK